MLIAASRTTPGFSLRLSVATEHAAAVSMRLSVLAALLCSASAFSVDGQIKVGLVFLSLLAAAEPRMARPP
jgi:hypothetical protein